MVADQTIPATDRGNIVLTGFMGTGKSTVGRVLASQLDFEFVDTDEVIERRHGSIATIFRDRGEAAFRLIEREVAVELARRARTVIATGGRMMLDPANIELFTKNGRVFCLAATPDEILVRVTADVQRADRPLLAGPEPREAIIDLLAERSAGYACFEQIATDARPPEAIAAEIAERLNRSEPAPT